MHKNGLVIGGAVIVIAAIIIGASLMHKGNDAPVRTSGTANGGAAQSYKVVPACQAFTLADAKAVLGQEAKASTANGSSDSQSNDLAVSVCSYSGAAGSVEDTQTVTVLARSAKSSAGAASNESLFGKDKPAGKQDVPGMGQSAFWDAQLSQLSVLQDHNLYIIGNMKGTGSNSGTLDVSTAVYQQIKNKL
jgi:hypothetical protein